MLSLANDINIDNLRKQYSQPAHLWPKPTLDEGVEHVEIGLIPIPTFPQANPFGKEKIQEYWNGDVEKKKLNASYFGVGDLSVSHDHSLLGYSLDLNGSEYYTIHILSLIHI